MMVKLQTNLKKTYFIVFILWGLIVSDSNFISFKVKHLISFKN